MIGFRLVGAIRAGEVRVRPGIATLTAPSVRFVDAPDLFEAAQAGLTTLPDFSPPSWSGRWTP